MSSKRLAYILVFSLLCFGPGVPSSSDNGHFHVEITEEGVTVSETAARARRQAPPGERKPDKHGYSQEEKQMMLDVHNKLRKITPATDAKFLYWDDKLAAIAQDYAEKCIFKHNPNRVNIHPDFQYIGENLYAGTGNHDPAYVVQLWYDEIKDYDYNTMGCTNVCGHYTQVVWSSTFALGCGVTYCPVLQNVNFGHGYNVVCNYGPGGNYQGVRPYRTNGGACTQCEGNAPFCVAGMCAPYPMILGGKTRLFSAKMADRAAANSLSISPVLGLSLLVAFSPYGIFGLSPSGTF